MQFHTIFCISTALRNQHLNLRYTPTLSMPTATPLIQTSQQRPIITRTLTPTRDDKQLTNTPLLSLDDYAPLIAYELRVAKKTDILHNTFTSVRRTTLKTRFIHLTSHHQHCDHVTVHHHQRTMLRRYDAATYRLSSHPTPPNSIPPTKTPTLYP